MDYGRLIPVNVLTGFLGSGKTTLLAGALEAPELAGAAVLVNEIGAVGLDHHLLETVRETTLLLENGCICCSVRGDLRDALRTLHDQRERALIPRYDRVVIETSGLADPVPVAYTLLTDPVIQHHYRLGHIVTVVDAVNVCASLEAHEETGKQIAVADRLVLTKGDLCDTPARAAAVAAVRSVNRAAPLLEAARAAVPAAGTSASDVPASRSPRADVVGPGGLPADAMARDGDVPAANPVRRALVCGHDSAIAPLAGAVARLFAEDAPGRVPDAAETRLWLEAAGGSPHGHAAETATLALTYAEPLDWTAFGIWLTALLSRYGDRILRVKALLAVDGMPGPVLVNGVQHIVHPPRHLPAWPPGLEGSCIVIIARGIDVQQLRASLHVFMTLARKRAA